MMIRIVAFAMLLLAEGLRADEVYKVGVAAMDITPSHPIRLNGFGMRRAESEGVYQKIWAKALAIEDSSGEPVLLIATDVLGIPDDIRSELAGRFARKAGLKSDRLSITATHTHTGPMLKGANETIFGIPIPQEHLDNIGRYTAQFLDKVEQVGLEALAKRQPARLSYGIGQAGFAINRRTKGGPVDHDLPVLVVRDLEGEIRAVHCSYACHCVTLSFNKLGGDWAGYAQEAIENLIPGAVALISIGCGADANPSSGVTGDKVDIATGQGREVAAEVRRLCDTALTPVRGRISTALQKVSLALDRIPTRAEWEEKAKRTDAIGYHARIQIQKLDRNEPLRTKVEYSIQSWQFGDSLAWAFLPGEVVVDYSKRLKRELDGQRLICIAYANEAPCYIPSERVLKEGGYEGGGAMIYYDQPTKFAPGLEDQIVSEARNQLVKTFPGKFNAQKTGGTMPLSPQQSLAAMRTHPGLKVELVASEPLLNSPVAIDFGADGRLWVAEMIDYPQGKSGQFEPGGRISVLESTGKQQFDKATVFLDDIPFPTGVMVWGKGVLVCAAPNILYAEDTDGDGKADVVRKLFSGFGTGNFQARVNSLQLGLDGWVYGSCGLFGGTIRSFNGKEYPLGDRDFRIRPETGELEPVTGRTQQGRVRDDAGNWFGCDNSTLIVHYPLDDQYLKRNPYVVAPNSRVFVPSGADANRLFPAKRDQQRFKLSGPANYVTAACGLGIYRDQLLGGDYEGNSFTCEPVNLVVHRLKLSPKQSTFTGVRDPAEHDSEFLASTDNWFRPVQALTGPDGALWIVDMYRFIIEHPRWIPADELEKLDVRAGQGMGRIYRVRNSEAPARPWQRLDQLDAAGLVQALDSANGWQRDMATQLLVRKNDPSCVPGLESLARSASRWQTRLHALAILDGLGKCSSQAILRALTDSDASVRRHAVRLAEARLAAEPDLASAVLERTMDTDAQVRLQVAYSLGAWSHPRAARALAELIVKHGDDPYLQAAVLSSLNSDNLAQFVATVFAEAGSSGPRARVMVALDAMIRGMKHREAEKAIVEKATEPHDGKFWPWQFAIAGERLAHASSLSADVKTRMLPMQDAARSLIQSPKASIDDQVLAVELLGFEESASRGKDIDLLAGFLGPKTAPKLRAAAIGQLARLGNEPLARALERWSDLPPASRSQLLDLHLATAARTHSLLSAIEQGAIRPGEIDAACRQKLLGHATAPIRDRSVRIFDGAINADRQKVVAQFANVTASGDAIHGKTVFARVCATCHRLQGEGSAVGPDLQSLVGRPVSYFVQEIFDPNRNVDSRYVEYQALLKSGRSVSGLLASETGTTILLRGPQARDETILRTEIDELRSLGRSLMPEGLEKDLSPTDLIDLLTFLTFEKPTPKKLPGNTPAIIKADQGRLTLKASEAEIYGESLAFEADFHNLGMWHGKQDRAEWRVSLAAPLKFDAFIDFACAADSAGNGFAFEGFAKPIRGKVVSTGGWDRYLQRKIGSVTLPAGESRLIFRPDGELKNALIDLRTIYLVPSGQTPQVLTGRPEPMDPKDIAAFLLDDMIPTDQRVALIAKSVERAGAIVAALAPNPTAELKDEYARVPWIFRMSIAGGKRNIAGEIVALLQVALPAEGQTMREWQAVAIGGGVINGISQANVWPSQRIPELIGSDASLMRRWRQAIDQSFRMADDEKVRPGTRYDALRMVALAGPERAIPILAKYLNAAASRDLEMGAVSGLSDIDTPEATSLLIKNAKELSVPNRALAMDALLRTKARTQQILEELKTGVQLKKEWISADQRKQLLAHADPEIRKAAELLFGTSNP